MVLRNREVPTALTLETEPDGTRAVGRLLPGTWDVSAHHPQYVPVSTGAVVQAGRAAEVILEFKEGGRVTGTVTEPAGEPIARVDVNLLHGETRTFILPELSARTDPEGRFSIEGIPSLRFGLHFRHARFRPRVEMGLEFQRPGEEREVNVTLEPGSMVSGRVVEDSGAPIAGASVIASNENASLVKSDAEGRFTIYGLGDQPVNLSASARGYGTAFVRGIPPNAAGIEIRLPWGGSLAGRVAADPIPETFAIILTRYDEDFRKNLRVKTETFGRADGGRFVLRDVSPGPYWVEVEAEGYEAAEAPQVTVNAGQATEGVVVALRKRK
jgi:hypothetical protein